MLYVVVVLKMSPYSNMLLGLFPLQVYLSASIVVHRGSQESLPTSLNIEFFVMSKCPDAKFCEDTFLPVIKELAPLVTVNFTSIGGALDSVGVPSCMHGASECEGNRQRLCAQKAAEQDGAVDKLLTFSACQDADAANIPKCGEACASEAGLDTADFMACAKSGGEGQSLFKAAAARSKALGIKISCTVRVQDEVFCVHNGDWTNCSSCGEDKPACLRTKICDSVSSENSKKAQLCS